MPLKLRLDLDRHSIAFHHEEIFNNRSLDRKALIVRYRGTQCTPADHGTIVTAWQKSVYRFGGFPLDETIVATILVRRDGIVHGLHLDRRSHGGLGPLCDFSHLQQCMVRTLRGRRFSSFSRVCPTAGDAQCLHLFEVLSSAASFYAHLEALGRNDGAEEELLRICPEKGGIRTENSHWVLGQLRECSMTLRHNTRPRISREGRPEFLDAELTVLCDGDRLNETVQADDFRGMYGRLNRLLAAEARKEKAAFGVKGRMRFTNMTALVGLLLLTISHESMLVMRALRIELLLHDLQNGGERATCVAFGSIHSALDPIIKRIPPLAC